MVVESVLDDHDEIVVLSEQSLGSRQIDRHFIDGLLRCIFYGKKGWVPIMISLQRVLKRLVDNMSASVNIRKSGGMVYWFRSFLELIWASTNLKCITIHLGMILIFASFSNIKLQPMHRGSLEMDK